MKEIGGYLEMERFSGEEYHRDLIGVNNGRSGLLYLLRAKKIKKLYIPYFLCDSVSKMCDYYGYAYEYYPIDRNFLPIFDLPLAEGQWLYIVNYYGQISNEQILRWKARYQCVIFDNVQAFFQRPAEGVDTIYSCRKFFGVPDGGYLATDTVLDEPLEQDVSKDRMGHILGRFEGCASDYYGDFKSNDRRFVELPLRKMSKLTRNLLRAIDYDAVRQKRNENYNQLEQALGSANLLKLVKPDGPYCYPFYHEKGIQLKRQLAAKGIYVATLWPNVLELEDALARDYATNILPLPCDQRYGASDMQRMVKEIFNICEDW